jgi:peptide deformylase
MDRLSKKTHLDILRLGNPLLYQVCDPVLPQELDQVSAWVKELDEAMQSVRAHYGFGRAIAAPQLGIMKRLIYMHIDIPQVFINPEITYTSEAMMEIWDDCMSFPNLLVKVNRHQSIIMTYLDLDWHEQTLSVEGDLSELLQHEYDHLNGILCTMRAIDNQSFKWRP